MADGTSNTESESHTKIRDIPVTQKEGFSSWLLESDREPFLMAFVASEEKAGQSANTIDIRNSVNFLEGFLGRVKFPDDAEAERIKIELGEKAPYISSASPEKYEDLRQSRASYAQTIRGDLTNRLDRLKAREADMIALAKRAPEVPKIKIVR